jgi:ubiquinone/menaquinone biosynthesis C-methylase UbiE
MERILEPELMDDFEQAEAYANADFEEPHSRVIELFDSEFPGIEIKGRILDLGCGSGDITFRFARRFPEATVIGVDGSAAMIQLADERKSREKGVADKVQFIEGFIPGAAIPDSSYDLIVSNSLLHHLHQPNVMWETILDYASPGTKIFVVDLMRPDSKKEAQRIVNQYSGDEPEILKRDFYHSLLAAFKPAEVEQQLSDVGLAELAVKVVSDRHLIIYGTLHRQS